MFAMPLLALDLASFYPLRNPISSASHLIWCVFSLFAGLLLIRLARGNPLKVVSLSIFTASMVLLYFSSGLYHALRLPDEQLLWYKLIDHSAIYLLIAGTYTPVVAVMMTGWPRFILLTAVWSLAAIGIATKWLLPLPPYQLTVGIYIAMGWVGMLQLRGMFEGLGNYGMFLALLGGLFYTVGAVSDAINWPVIIPGILGPHEILHLTDIAGTLTHIIMMYRCVLPFEPRTVAIAH